MTKRKFLLQGAILTAVSLFLRVTNMGYRSFLSQKMGSAGMGLYQLIFSIFMLTVTLSTSGISLAVTRMVSAAIAAGRREVIRSTVARYQAFHCRLAVPFGKARCHSASGNAPGSPLPADPGGGAALYVVVHLHERVFLGCG